MPSMVDAIDRELILQKNYLTHPIETLYLGGGTPGLLDSALLKQLFHTLSKHYTLTDDVEITIELNPDDCTADKISFLRDETPVNRLSLGVQSFFDEDLVWMNRSHSVKQSLEGIAHAQQKGFNNITIDLIYGLPFSNNWSNNLCFFSSLGLQHLSAYALTTEPNTLLQHWIHQQKYTIDDDKQRREFDELLYFIETHSYEYYEISNFSLPNFRSKHNTSYWQFKPYLGIGPSAHSFDGDTRQWNISNNAQYMRSMTKNIIPFTKEILSPKDKFNELIMTGLRTVEGIDLNKVQNLGSSFSSYLAHESQQKLTDGILSLQPTKRLSLNRDHRFYADRIASDLFML